MTHNEVNNMEWQLIETAPKDGTRIILFREEYQEDMCIGWWSNGTNEWIPVQGVLFSTATHWMPRPKAPKP